MLQSCSFGALYTNSYAQLSQTQRYEREQKNSDDYFNVISLKEEGLALFRERDKYKNNNQLWELILLDTALQEKSTIELEVKDRYKMVGYEVSPGHLYFLYRTGETTKNDFELIDVDLKGTEARKLDVIKSSRNWISNLPILLKLEIILFSEGM